VPKTHDFQPFRPKIINLKPISNLLKNLKSLPKKLGRNWSLWPKFKNLTQSRFFNFYGTISLVLLVLIFKGGDSEDQNSLFKNMVKTYIEETSASIINISHSQNQLANINSLSALSSQNLGRGGVETVTFETSTIQDNSVIANNPATTNYLATGFKRNQIVEYTVQPGDLLSFISSDYGVNIDSLMWANGLTNANSIKPGQILRIPPVSGVIHKVKTGDTIASIAKKYGVEPEKILSFNDLKEKDTLSLNDELIVPDGQIKTFIVSKPGTQTTTAKRFSYLPDLGDYFMIPTQGRLSQGLHGRNGADKANTCGTPIYASSEGNATTVDENGYNGGFGKFIKITHPNGTETLYAHLSKITLTPGKTVTRGQQIGLMGSTGRSTGCHLHFEVHGARNPLIKY